MNTKPIKKNVHTFTMRINNELWETIKELARTNKRSAAKEIEFVIEQYLKSQK